MKKFLTTYLFLLLAVTGVFASETEILKYVISYKWGIVHKEAGDIKITKTPKAGGYELKLVGTSRPWADKIYSVRDTLISQTAKDYYLPIKYTRLAHEKGKYGHDEINFSRSGATTKGKGIKYRQKKDGTVYSKDIDIQGTGPTYDLLSILYYVRGLDYKSLGENRKVGVTVFSGDQVEKVTITTKGKEKIKLADKSERDAWHIVFKFTTHGGKKSSEDIDCWFSDDASRIPLLIVGSLPVGQIRCTYVP